MQGSNPAFPGSSLCTTDLIYYNFVEAYGGWGEGLERALPWNEWAGQADALPSGVGVAYYHANNRCEMERYGMERCKKPSHLLLVQALWGSNCLDGAGMVSWVTLH